MGSSSSYPLSLLVSFDGTPIVSIVNGKKIKKCMNKLNSSSHDALVMAWNILRNI